MEQLDRLIGDIIMPDIWADAGGTEIKVVVGTRIIISGKAPLHRKVGQFIGQLRESDAWDVRPTP
jgi:hypothetical protein